MGPLCRNDPNPLLCQKPRLPPSLTNVFCPTLDGVGGEGARVWARSKVFREPGFICVVCPTLLCSHSCLRRRAINVPPFQDRDKHSLWRAYRSIVFAAFFGWMLLAKGIGPRGSGGISFYSFVPLVTLDSYYHHNGTEGGLGRSKGGYKDMIFDPPSQGVCRGDSPCRAPPK